MFFCADTYLDLAIDTIASKTPFDINQFAYVLFTLVLVFALCSNAPKLAVTLLSGQAQMANRSYYSKYYNKANKAPMPNASLNQSFSGNNGSAKPALPQSNNSNKLPSPGLPGPKN